MGCMTTRSPAESCTLIVGMVYSPAPEFGLLYLFPKAPAKVSSERTAAKFNFSLHLHNISHFLDITYIIYIIYINFIYITYIIYISYISSISFTSPTSSTYSSTSHVSPASFYAIYRCSTSTYLLQNSCNVICTEVVAWELFHGSSYTGVHTRELLHRSWLPGDLLASEFPQTPTSQVLLQ